MKKIVRVVLAFAGADRIEAVGTPSTPHWPSSDRLGGLIRAMDAPDQGG
ncbi:MAG: hypothetical protein HYZ58_18760 [Acidobacteria bacterium]|nr:hypothetical protein [Acidobacteriota bacterium]MBI3265174.1 hypothetical protein [Acidobacteriota bacterium]